MAQTDHQEKRHSDDSRGARRRGSRRIRGAQRILARGLCASALLIFASLASCTDSQGPTPTPIEQLPNPEFARKPQIHFIVDSENLFWNLPNAAEIDQKQRARLTLVTSSDFKVLDESLRELNSREGDLLVFSGPRLVATAKIVALFAHPSGRKTFFFDSATPFTPGNIPSLHLDLAPAFDLLKSVCARWQKELKISCAWDARIPGSPVSTPAPARSIAVGFLRGDSSTLQLLLKIDWVQWMEQFLHDFAAKRFPEPATWQRIGLDSATLRLDLIGEDPLLPELKRILQEERLKRL